MSNADNGWAGAVTSFVEYVFSGDIDRARRLVEENGGRI
jgi:hypothetical protein